MRPLVIAFLIAAPVFAQNLPALIDNQLAGLLEIYKDIHAHPELSHQESRTSALLASEQAQCLADHYASADYRRHLVNTEVERALASLRST